MRAVALGIGEVSKAKASRLFVLRSQVLILMREMATVGFITEPLLEKLESKELDVKLLAVQKSFEGLNSVWREQARMRVKPALEETVKRYLSRLRGSLRFVDQETPTTPGAINTRKYFHVPESVQDSITQDNLAALKVVGEHGDALALFRQVVLNGDAGALNAAQVAVLVDIHARALKKHTAPSFGSTDDFTLQLHIDARMVPQDQAAAALEVRKGVGFLLNDPINVRYHRFLDIAGVAAREERIRLPLVLGRKMANRIESSNGQWASLILEISEHSYGVRLVVGKPQEAIPEAVKAFVGRDFGYANTVSLCVAVCDHLVDIDSIQTSLEKLNSKEAVEAFIAKSELQGNPVIVERVRFEGRAFLKRISTLCDRIDGYKSRIDLAYNELNALKGVIVKELALQGDDRITTEMKKAHPQVSQFFTTLALINDLKNARRALYRKITAIKKAWFGLLGNIEIALAKKYRAAIVREDLTVEAIEKEKPDYKGRIFNKMINNGSKGQYQKRASDKMLFNGVAEIVVPSWYTSRACFKHSRIVEKKHRSGERIYLPCCGHHDHADEHAADTIASYALLVQKLTLNEQSFRVCDTSEPLTGKHRLLGR